MERGGTGARDIVNLYNEGDAYAIDYARLDSNLPKISTKALEPTLRFWTRFWK
jgi:hypothetical protein